MRFEDQVIYPHPVLRPDVEDYKDGDFEVVLKYWASPEHSFVEISAQYHLSVPELLHLVKLEKISVGLLVDCRDTFYRKVLPLGFGQRENIIIDGGQLHGKVELVPIIYAVTQIIAFTSQDFAEEFKGLQFDLEPGDLVAYGEPEEFYLEREFFKPLESIISLSTIEDKTGFQWDISLDEDQIKIEVSQELSQYIQSARNSSSHRVILINSLYFSALQTAVCFIQREPNIEVKWANVIRQKCLYTPGLDIQKEEPHLIVQRLLEFPIERLSKSVFNGNS